jgi:hypothetical protein
MAINKFVFPYRSFSIKTGSEISFWENNILICIVSDTVTKVLETFPQNVPFRRDLIGLRLATDLIGLRLAT